MTGTRVSYWPAAASPVDANYDALVWYGTNEKWNGTSRLIIACHGHGGTALQFQPSLQSAGPGAHISALVASGRYVVVATADRGDQWGSAGVMSGITNAVTWARNKGVRSGRYGLLGYSMGAMAAAVRLRADTANIAATLTWAGALDASYIWNAGNSTWTNEMTTAHTSLATQQLNLNDPLDAAGKGAYNSMPGPWKIYHAANDATLNVSIARAFAAKNIAKVTYTELASGDHFPYTVIPPADTLAFFDSGAW